MSEGLDIFELMDRGQPSPAFQGSTYQAAVDFARLSSNLQRVYWKLLDGDWHSASELRQVGGAEATRRARDLRGAVWGPLKIERRPADQAAGKWEYRLDRSTITPHIHEKILNKKPDLEADPDPCRQDREHILRVVQAADPDTLQRIMDALGPVLAEVESPNDLGW